MKCSTIRVASVDPGVDPVVLQRLATRLAPVFPARCEIDSMPLDTGAAFLPARNQYFSAVLVSQLHRIPLAAATRLLSVSAVDLAVAIERTQAEARDVSREARRLHEQLAGHEAAGYRARAETIGGLRGVLSHEPGRDAGQLKTLAAAIVSESGLVAVLVGDGQPAPVVAARSTDTAVDAGALVKALAAECGGRGGGRPELAQGGIAADAATIVARARAWLRSWS